MKTLSAANLTGKRNYVETLPALGTRRRAAYDRLMQNKGQYVKVPEFKKDLHGPEAFRDTYGLDIRSMPDPNEKRTGRGRKHAIYACVGEWFGKVYVDYTKEATKQAEKCQL